MSRPPQVEGETKTHVLLDRLFSLERTSSAGALEAVVGRHQDVPSEGADDDRVSSAVGTVEFGLFWAVGR
jgi:hypothetical protein